MINKLRKNNMEKKTQFVKKSSLTVILVLAALLTFFGLARAQFETMTPIEVPIKLKFIAETAEYAGLGAYISSPTTFTDVNIDNDLVVDGLTTLTGAVDLTSTTTIQEMVYG